MIESTKTSSNRWARLPNQWMADDGLKFFRGGSEQGTSMAALKVLVAILVHAENNSVAKAGPFQGSAAMSYTELCNLTGLSRGKVSSGIKKLKAGDFVSVAREGQGGRNRFFLAHYGANDRYAPLPVKKMWAGGMPNGELKFLRGLSGKNQSEFLALKLYLLLCGNRDKRTGAAKISFEGIFRRSGIPEARIRSALSVLYDHGLVRRLEQKQPGIDKRNPPNEYFIRGLDQPRTGGELDSAVAPARISVAAQPA
jgi:DNA-binding transcriptional ArsR family regulator